MKLYLGLTESSSPQQTRVFAEVDGKFVDLNLAYAAYLAQVQGDKANAYELSAFYFPKNIAVFLQRGEPALKALEEVLSFTRKNGIQDLYGPAGEKILYHPKEIRLLPPFQKPEKSFVIGFSDQARVEAMPKPEIPTGFYKLPQTFVTTGAPIVLPKFLRGSRRRCLPRYRDRQSRQKNPTHPGVGPCRRSYALNRRHGARHQPSRRSDDQQLARQKFSVEHLFRPSDTT